MSSGKTKILMVSVIALVLLVIGGIFIWKENNSPKNISKKTNNEPNQPTEKCFKCGKECGSSPIKKNKKTYCSQKCADNGNGGGNNNGKEKDLVEKIKTDLKERISRIKNSKNKPESSDWTPYVIFNDEIACQVVGGIGFLKERESFTSTDVGSENYQEIINLISQAREAFWGEWINRRNQKYQQKVANNPNLFYCPTKSSFDSSEFFRDETTNWDLSGKQNGKHYNLIIPLNHPDLTNVPFQPLDYNFYLITGIENIPLVPSPLDGSGLYKIVKSSDQITIKLIEN